MKTAYSISYNGDIVGTARVCRYGLYYQIQCRCDLPDNDIYRIFVTCNGNTADLGICIPLGGEFGVQTQIPVKRLGEGEMCLYVKPKTTASSKQFIPVSTTEPFPYLSELLDSRLEVKGEVIGVCVQKVNSRPTGQ